MSLTIRYLDCPQGAQENAVVTTGTAQPFADPQSIAAGGSGVAYATLEPGIWTLDGTRSLLPDAPAGVGWWSDALSGADGRFDDPPAITLSLSAPYTATGLTFTFWPSTGQYCAEVYLEWYNGTTLLAQTTCYPTGPQFTLPYLADGFDRIRIELRATAAPYQFAKLQQLQIGQLVIFAQDELVQATLVNEIDPMLSDLTVDALAVTVRDRRNRTLLPQENQRMELYRDDRLLAVHYITDSSRQSGSVYTFSCQSVIGLLEDEYLGGIYNAVPVETLLDDILDGRAWQLDAAFAGQPVTGYLPVCTRREALQQLSFALGAAVSTQGTDAIVLAPLPEAVGATFAAGSIFPGAKIESRQRVARIDLTAHRYTPSTAMDTLIDGEEITGTGLLITFDQPHHSYAITGGTITASGANWVTITADGPVTLTGLGYLHAAAVYTRRNATATAAERSNVLTVDGATLVHDGNAAAVMDRLYATAQLRQTLTQDAVIADQRAGQRAASINPWGRKTQGYITAMHSTFTRTGHTASVTILGVEVAASGVHNYAGELYAGDREVLY